MLMISLRKEQELPEQSCSMKPNLPPQFVCNLNFSRTPMILNCPNGRTALRREVFPRCNLVTEGEVVEGQVLTSSLSVFDGIFSEFRIQKHVISTLTPRMLRNIEIPVTMNLSSSRKSCSRIESLGRVGKDRNREREARKSVTQLQLN
jgi:hypothetical protein